MHLPGKQLKLPKFVEPMKTVKKALKCNFLHNTFFVN